MAEFTELKPVTTDIRVPERRASMFICLVLILLFLPAGAATISAVRRRGVKNLFRQEFQNPTPVMTAVWFVFLLISAVATISTGTIGVVLIAVYNGMLPTVPDAFHSHPTQVVGHMAYLSNFQDMLFAGMWWQTAGSFVVGFAVFCIYSLLGEREKERRHNIRIEWMKSRPE